MMEAPALAAHGLTKRWGKVVALDGLDLDVPRGTITGLLGPGGAGKSTVVRLLAGLARPTDGTATVAGVPVRFGDGVAGRRRLGVLHQEPRFYDWMTGRELLTFVADLGGVPAAAMASKVDALLERVGLADHAGRRAAEYSYAMRRRLGLAQALVGDPEVVLLDEPATALRAADREVVLRLIGELRDTATVLIATPDLADVEAVCDRVAVLAGGRLLVESSVDELLGRYAPATYLVQTDAGGGLAMDGLVARLRSEPWVSTAIAVGGTLRLAVSDEAGARRELLPAIVATGLSISAIRRERPSLAEMLGRLERRGGDRAAGDGQTP